MKFLESDLEEIIYNSDRQELSDRGLKIKGKLYRQVKIGNYGIADLISVYRRNGTLQITVYELKKEKIGISSFFQAIGYLRGIQSYLRERGFYQFSLDLILIGRSVDISGSFCYIPELFNNYSFDPQGIVYSIAFFTYSYSITGMSFEEQNGMSLKEEGFSEKLKLTHK